MTAITTQIKIKCCTEILLNEENKMFLQSWNFYLNLFHTFYNMGSSVWIYFSVEHPVVTNFILTSSWPVKLCDFFWSRFSKIVLKCTNLDAYNSIKQNKLHAFKRHSFFQNLKIWVCATKLVTGYKRQICS